MLEDVHPFLCRSLLLVKIFQMERPFHSYLEADSPHFSSSEATDNSFKFSPGDRTKSPFTQLPSTGVHCFLLMSL